MSTTATVLIREHAERVKPPRALAVPFYFGYTFGKPEDPEYQHRVLGLTLDLLERENGPVLEDFPDDEEPIIHPQASQVAISASKNGSSPADEITALRTFYERWSEKHAGRTAVGLTGIPQRRFRGVIRFLEAYSKDEEADMTERPEDMPIPQFIRYCVDDLKAFYYEARMAQRPDAPELEVHEWFWGETATGDLIKEIAEMMKAKDDPALGNISFGLAR